jgi:hypothetical protein
MAIKITCMDCHKRISIDAAFAGGVCRCPYCKATNDVPLKSRSGMSAPSPASAAKAGTTPKRIPVAKRAGYQGAMAIVLFGILLITIVAIVVAVVMSQKGNGVGPNGVNTNPFVTGDANTVAGNAPISTPVVYCIEAGSSMRSFYDDAVSIVDASMGSLGPNDRCQIVLATDDGFEVLSASGRQALIAEARAIDPAGGSPVDEAFAEAVDLGPAMVVLITRKGVFPSAIDVAKDGGAKVTVVVLDGIPSVDSEMEALAEATGGAFRTFTAVEIEKLRDQAGLRD